MQGYVIKLALLIISYANKFCTDINHFVACNAIHSFYFAGF